MVEKTKSKLFNITPVSSSSAYVVTIYPKRQLKHLFQIIVTNVTSF